MNMVSLEAVGMNFPTLRLHPLEGQGVQAVESKIPCFAN